MLMKQQKIEKLFKEADRAINNQQFGETINALNRILAIDPKNKRARALKAYYNEILLYRNTDIYASTNLFMDPWQD